MKAAQSEGFDFETYQNIYGKNALKLFAVDSRDRLQIFTPDTELEPKADWESISLIPPEQTEK